MDNKLLKFFKTFKIPIIIIIFFVFFFLNDTSVTDSYQVITLVCEFVIACLIYKSVGELTNSWVNEYVKYRIKYECEFYEICNLFIDEYKSIIDRYLNHKNSKEFNINNYNENVNELEFLSGEIKNQYNKLERFNNFLIQNIKSTDVHFEIKQYFRVHVLTGNAIQPFRDIGLNLHEYSVETSEDEKPDDDRSSRLSKRIAYLITDIRNNIELIEAVMFQTRTVD